ncbi:hypothetical protein AVEN_233608-1 [Araneus ventricosus]|uniref:Uncharacterized protein n=1 Tax=Araneus ventricosus TaxID=182803 RepID=A0A4Y2NCK7_ARAVE|nr:hypothetical protein AVEN_73721-1 [Araneus ventricosus]GBN36942.1 hypothetical protein AVEN_233608-1 [Araneus ventricosus]
MPATKKKCENEMLKCHCCNCFSCNHLSPKCCQCQQMNLSSGIKCSNKNKFQQKEHCIREKSGKVCCGCVQKRCKSCNRVSCCHCKTCCNRKDNVYLQDTSSSDRHFKNGKYIDSKMRKRMKLDMQDKKFIEEDITEGKRLKNVPKHHKVKCKCSDCSKQNRKLTSIDDSKKMKVKHNDHLPSDINENDRMLWYTFIFLIMFAIIFEISMLVAHRKKLNILAMPLLNYFGFNTKTEPPSYWNRYRYLIEILQPLFAPLQ